MLWSHIWGMYISVKMPVVFKAHSHACNFSSWRLDWLLYKSSADNNKPASVTQLSKDNLSHSYQTEAQSCNACQPWLSRVIWQTIVNRIWVTWRNDEGKWIAAKGINSTMRLSIAFWLSEGPHCGSPSNLKYSISFIATLLVGIKHLLIQLKVHRATFEWLFISWWTILLRNMQQIEWGLITVIWFARNIAAKFWRLFTEYSPLEAGV